MKLRNALALLLVLAVWVNPERGSAQDCGTDNNSPPPVALSWLQVPNPTDQTRGSRLTLVARNVGTKTESITLRVVSDLGGTKRKIKRVSIERLPAGGSDTVTVDLGRLRAPESMALAGQIYATANVLPEGACNGGACERLRPVEDDSLDPDIDADGRPLDGAVEVPEIGEGSTTIAAPLVFFHRSSVDPTSFEIYGEDVLADTYNGGDLSGRMRESLADTVVRRVADGGAGLRPNSKMRLEEALPTEAELAPASGGPGDIAVPDNAYHLCVKWEVGLNEQGRKVTLQNGNIITEDYWHGYGTLKGTGVLAASSNNDSSGNIVVAARGVRVRVSRDGWHLETNTDPKTGCFSFIPPAPGPFILSAFGEHHDAHGNTTVVRTADGKGMAWQKVINPPVGKTRAVAVGNFDPFATMAAISGFAMYRSAMGNENKTIDLRGAGFCYGPGGNVSSAHFRFDGLDDGIAYLRMSDGTGIAPGPDNEPCTTADHRRAKFIVTHEMGHAWMLLRTKQAEPDAYLDETDPYETVCSQGASYTPDSLEASAIGAREGMAHFYSTSVWNNTKSANAVFSMFGDPRDVEFYSNKKGGQLWNLCTAVVKCGRSVNMDWLRFWWDLHTPYAAGKPSLETIATIYETAITNGGIQRYSYYHKFREAMQPLLTAAQESSWDNAASWNGVDTSPTGSQCIAPFTYPNCDGDPNALAGEVDCPCADVLPVNANTPNDISGDGYYPDGAGSYAKHGTSGTGQYCFDEPGAKGVCGVVDYANSPQPAAICQRCGEDTMIGCPCTSDEQCDGLDAEDLDCLGAPANGWAGSTPGTCLPTTSTPAGRGRLEELRWFCLDNCGSKGGGDPDSFACTYDQLPHPLDHAECIAVSGACSASEAYCESSGANLVCNLDATCPGDEDQCCSVECSNDTDCTLLGFPDFYSCNSGSCVPPECIGSFSAYCQLYR